MTYRGYTITEDNNGWFYTDGERKVTGYAPSEEAARFAIDAIELERSTMDHTAKMFGALFGDASPFEALTDVRRIGPNRVGG